MAAASKKAERRRSKKTARAEQLKAEQEARRLAHEAERAEAEAQRVVREAERAAKAEADRIAREAERAARTDRDADQPALARRVKPKASGKPGDSRAERRHADDTPHVGPKLTPSPKKARAKATTQEKASALSPMALFGIIALVAVAIVVLLYSRK